MLFHSKYSYMEIHICEECGKEHDGTYGRGRFCSKVCRGRFTAKGKRQKHLTEYIWECNYCSKTFESRRKLFEHKHIVHNSCKRWNKGFTKNTHPSIAKQAKTASNNFKSGLTVCHWTGKHLPKEMREKISKSMKIAHFEGRAHNIGESRWNNKPSYPESWFMKAIENNFVDKKYVREYPFHTFSLDFAWIDKKKCIEIDGEQHQRFEEYKERDKRKDIAIQANGWKVLRIVWKDMFSEPQKWIAIAKEFIDN